MDAYIGIWGRDVIAAGREHLPHMWAGFPAEVKAAECEICDILWLIDQREGDQTENLLNLQAALSDHQ